MTTSSTQRGALMICLGLALALALVFASTRPAPAASSSVAIGVTVTPATSINATACVGQVAGSTDFGTVLPGTTAFTTADCDVRFGSSNNTSQLRVGSTDGAGVAMYSSTRGDLDTSFSTNGIVTGGQLNINEQLYRYPDGRMLTAGGCLLPGSVPAMCVARFQADGTPDSLFGGGDGIVQVQTNATYAGNIEATSLDVLADGRILAAGNCGDSAYRLCVLRFASDGSPDLTMAGDGMAEIDVSGTGVATYNVHVALQPDGRMFVGSLCWSGMPVSNRCTARLLASGALDLSYDGDGRSRFPAEAGYDEDEVTDAFVDTAGRYVIVGRCYADGGSDWTPQVCVSRQLPSGQLDTTYAGDGIARLPNAGFDLDGQTFDSILQADGRVLSAGTCDDGISTWYSICVQRFNTDGSPDTSWAGDGSLVLNVDVTHVYWADMGVVQDEVGNVLITHTCDNGARVVCLLRLRPDGTRDPSMGTDGVAVLESGSSAVSDYAGEVALAPDGVVLVLGSCREGASAVWENCIYRLRANGVVADFVNDGTHDWDTAGTSIDAFGVCLRTTSGGATPTWPSGGGTCSSADGPHWQAVSSTPSTAAHLAATEPDPADATAHFRFGLRTAASQTPGRYVAPMTFTVVAPGA